MNGGLGRRVHGPTWVCLLMVLLLGCRDDEPATPTTAPVTVQATQPTESTPLYARYLEGVRICLDPGHGGRGEISDSNKGPTGLQEAEINLRVSQMLRDMLTAAGAVVVMTRDADVFLHPDEKEDLRLRAELANQSGCDFFISVHHNSSSRVQANFPSVWYHKDVNNNPVSLNIACELAAGLREELQLPEQLGCDVLSDQLMYKTGFAVLRQTRSPAVLVECSFFSNPEQEDLLRDPQYLRREARGLFAGLARYAYGGLPRAVLIEPADGRVSPGRRREVVVQLDDGLRARKSWGWERCLIPRDSITVRLNKESAVYNFDEASNRLNVRLPDRLNAGTQTLWVQFQNLFGHANLSPRIMLTVGGSSSRSP